MESSTSDSSDKKCRNSKIDELFSDLNIKPSSLVLNHNRASLECPEENEGINIQRSRRSRQWYSPNILSYQQPRALTESSNVIKVSNENQDKNNFRFEFKVRYDEVIEQHLYPRFYKNFKMNEFYVLQKAGAQRTVCLICLCEMWNMKSPSQIVGHISGTKHMNRSSSQAAIKSFENYHKIFMNLEPNFQAHQVYFAPDDNHRYLKCIICTLYVRTDNVFLHILNEPHKSRVLSLCQDQYSKFSFSLLDKHVQVYGIKTDNIDQPKKQPVRIKEKKDHGPNQNRNSNSSDQTNRNEKDKQNALHVIIKSIEDPKSAILSQFLPKRFKDHCQFLKLDDKSSFVTCTCCGIGNIVKAEIILHLIQPTHLNSAKIPLSGYSYYCEICDSRLHDEVEWFIHFLKTPIKHESMAPSRKDKVGEHECVTCKTIIFGDGLSLKRHQRIIVKKIEKKKAITLPKTVKIYFDSKNSIRSKGLKLLEEAEIVRNSTEDLMKCCEELENTLKTSFPICKAFPFGSRRSGLGSQKSDLDVFIDVGDMYNGEKSQDHHDQCRILMAAISLLKQNKKFKKITSRPTARTPIIRLNYSPINLDCDISFRHGLSVENTEFLRFCFEIQPISQELIILLKKWLNICGLHEKITTYALAMMAIFYLQTENYLISIKKLREINPYTKYVIDGWETISYRTPLEEIKKHIKIFDGDIVDIFKGFFEYYSNFNYKLHVVCPLMGEVVLKNQFTDDEKGGKLPPEMASYVRKINEEKDAEFFRAASEFCIQDPFDLSHNLTKACGLLVVEKFKNFNKLTYELLDKLE